MSAEKRLNVNTVTGNSYVSDRESDNIDMAKQKMKNIIDIVVAGDALQNLRAESENTQLFETFASYCLIHFMTSYNWWYNASLVVISNIFTVSDEALCILLLENNAADYAIMHREQRKINRREAKPKWTKVECTDKKIRAWDRRGMHRFNVFVNVIQTNRQLTVSKDMELELKSRYAKLSRNGIEENDNNTDSDDDDLDELNGYDGFGGDLELDRTTNIDANILVELVGVTNQTAV